MSVVRAIYFYTKTIKDPFLPVVEHFKLNKVCVDSSKVRELLSQDIRLKIKKVPALAVFYSDGTHATFVGASLKNWFDTVIQNAEREQEQERLRQELEAERQRMYSQPLVQEQPNSVTLLAPQPEHIIGSGMTSTGTGLESSIQASYIRKPDDPKPMSPPESEEEVAAAAAKKAGKLSAQEIIAQAQKLKEEQEALELQNRPQL